jgi:hypothetical protein
MAGWAQHWMLYTREESLSLPEIKPTYHTHTKLKQTATIAISYPVLYSVITVHLFTVTIYIQQLDATLFKKLYSFLKHI